MLATAVSALPRGDGWAYEFKWDGVRALVDVSTDGVRIHSRAGNEVTKAYPELVSLSADVGDALLDGEIVAFSDGRPSFDLLQRRMHVRSAADARRLAAEAPVTFVTFDLLRRFGVDLTARPYGERRATLDRWAAERPGWTLSPWFDDGAATEEAAHEHGLEGVVAKRIGSPYRPGVRSPDWQKLRFVRAGDFVVVGWEGAAERPGELSSVVLGCYVEGVLTYAGKAGSGLTTQSARELQGMLTSARACALPDPPPLTSGRVVHWVQPQLVVEVGFASWTDDRRLRHPVFRRMRLDKPAEEAHGDA
jgi:bifunctional non-homologous end joining protein LigD